MMDSQRASDEGRGSSVRHRFSRKYGRPRSSKSGALPEPDLSPETGAKLRTDLASVMKFIRAHESYTPPLDEEPIDGEQPKFDEIVRYGLSAKQETKLWEMEAERLIATVADFDEPLRFESPLSQWDINKAGFEKLSKLGNQAMHCLNICRHDNEVILFDSNMRDIFNPENYLKARNALSNTFDPPVEHRRPEKEGTSMPRKPGSVTSADMEGKTLEAFHALVDYTTASISRFALRGMPSEFWHIRALAGLAKTSAKIKFLFADLERFAIQSLDDGQDVLAKDEALNALGLQGKGPFLDIIDSEGRPFQIRENKDPTGRQDATDAADIHRLLSQEERGVRMYFSEMAMVSSWVVDSLRSVFYWLQKTPISGNPIDVFDICGLVYKAGLDGLPTLVYQDRDGELVGSSSRELVRLSYSGFKMLSEVAAELHKKIKPPPSATRDEVRSVRTVSPSTGALLVFEMEEEKTAKSDNPGQNFHLNLTNMEDLMALFVPLVIAQPVQLANLIWAAEIVTPVSSITYSIDYASLPGPRFTVFASLRTNAYENTVKKRLAASDARSLSQSLLAQNRLHTYDQREILGTTVWDGLPVADRRKKTTESEKKLHELEDQFKGWDIEEKAIIVKRWWYVVWVLLGCGVLVVGGIMVGCFLGTRLTGVDPFNITVFAWVLAGFVILVAKSLLVSEWPWRDFLKGRVPCRSVSELVAVTGVDEQEILEYLLSRELYTILVVKGPYCRPFSRKSDGDGFSIDKKLELRTLLASGILLVKVTGRQGPGLVCMDLRRGANGRPTIAHADSIKKDEYVLGCFDLHEAFDEGNDVPLLGVTTNWTRILGIYHKPKKLFR